MPTVIPKGGRVLVEEEAVANLPGHRVLDRAVQAQVQGATKKGRKLRRVPGALVVLAIGVLMDLVRKRIQILQPRANLCRVWLLSKGGISIASLAKGVLEAQALRLAQEDRGVLQSKVVEAQASPAVAPSRGSPGVQVVLRPRAMIGSLEALPHMSLVSDLQKHRVVTAKPLALNIS